MIATAITIYFESFHGKKTAKGPLGFRFKLLSALQFITTLGRGFTLPFLLLNVSRKAVGLTPPEIQPVSTVPGADALSTGPLFGLVMRGQSNALFWDHVKRINIR